MIELLNIDCMDYMKSCNDKAFDLAIVDVPYGIGEHGGKSESRCKATGVKPAMYKNKGWDNQSPEEAYFKELVRVSKNQIIWGANHFISRIPYDSPCWIVWDKDNGDNDFADCELAWTSFKTAVRKFKYKWHGMLQQDMKNKELRIHPTQKPVALYNWIYEKYSEPKQRILDTHLGSGSSAISAYYFDMNFVGCEIDNEYFDAMQKRYKEVTAQTKLF